MNIDPLTSNSVYSSKKLAKSPSMPVYNSPSSTVKSSLRCSIPKKSSLYNQRSSMHENKHTLPPEIDRAYEIKQRIMQAEKRKSVYEQTKKGIDNDNFINHMQTLRRSSKNHRKTLDTRYAIFTYHKSYSNSNKKMFRTMVNASGEIGVEPVPDLNVPQPLNLQPIYHNNPASPSSELPHFYITPRE